MHLGTGFTDPGFTDFLMIENIRSCLPSDSLLKKTNRDFVTGKSQLNNLFYYPVVVTTVKLPHKKQIIAYSVQN